MTCGPVSLPDCAGPRGHRRVHLTAKQELPDSRPENGTGTLGYADPASKVIVVDPTTEPTPEGQRHRA